MQATCQCASQLDRVGSHSIACEFLSQGRCKPVSLACKLLQGKTFQATTKTSSWWILQMVISSLIAEARLMMVGLLELSFFEKPVRRGHNQLQPLARKISTIYMLSSDILPSLLTVPSLKPLVFKSLVPSSCVKIVLWQGQAMSHK